MIWWGMVNNFPSMVHVRWTFKFLLFDSLNSLNSRNWRLCSTHWAPSLNWSSHSGETGHLFTSHQRWRISHHWAAPFFSKKRKETPFCSWDSRMKASYYENRAGRWLKSYYPTFGGVQPFGFANEFGSFQKGKWIDFIRNSSLIIWGYGFFIAEIFV